jgi:hypothetical protein
LAKIVGASQRKCDISNVRFALVDPAIVVGIDPDGAGDGAD